MQGAVSMPLHELATRSYELPAPFEAPLRLAAASERELAAARELLEARGWRIAHQQLISHHDRDTAPGGGALSLSLSPHVLHSAQS